MSDSPLFRAALQRTEGCPPPDALERQLNQPDPALATHIESCAFCKTEVELLRSFLQCDVPAEDAASVDAVVQRLHRAPAAPPIPFPARRRTWLRPMVLAAAAALVVAGVGLQFRRGGPPPLRMPGADVYRSGSVAILSPSGDLQAPPAEVRWASVPGASSFHVRLLEVDGNELWNTTVPGTTTVFPDAIRPLMVPAKTLAITVEAFNAQSQKIAESPRVNFRILQKIYGR